MGDEWIKGDKSGEIPFLDNESVGSILVIDGYNICEYSKTWNCTLMGELYAIILSS